MKCCVLENNMLTEIEKNGCRKLLDVVNDFDLRCLVQTITQNLVAIESRQEAVEAIIQYSTSVDELLNRQKVKKEHLQRFLIVSDKNALSTVAKSDKGALIRLTKEALAQVTKADASIERIPAPQCQEIALAFISWFYEMINSTRNVSNSSCWKADHFWDDSKLLLQVEQPDGIIRDEIHSAVSVSQKLLAFACEYQVTFSPNLASNGVQSEMNCHGLLAVKSAGTLHRGSAVVGLYEQVFGLIKDPLANGNWKVKNTELKAKLKCNENKTISSTHVIHQ